MIAILAILLFAAVVNNIGLLLSINQSTNQPINQSTNQPINQTTKQPIKQDCKIFIYESNEIPQKNLTNASNTDLWNDWHWMELPDFWYHSLYSHPDRTFDANEADVFFVPTYPTKGFPNQRITIQNQSIPIVKNGISNHFTVCGRLDYQCAKAWPKEMKKEQNILMLSIERWGQSVNQSYEIPYLNSFFESPHNPVQKFHNFHNRNRLISGCFNPRNGPRYYMHNTKARPLRDLLIDQCTKADDQICYYFNVSDVDGHNLTDVNNFMDVYLDSTFTLQPTGDSWGRKAIWDSLTVGSIPIIFSEASIFHFESPIFEWNGTDPNDQIFILIPEQAVINKSVNLIEFIQNISESKIKMIQQNMKRLISKFVYYDYQYRHQVKDRKKDVIDLSLDFLCKASKQAIEANNGSEENYNQSIKQPNNQYVPKLSNCSKIYFDLGSNIGVQTRKLFEPNLYPKAKILSFFNETFGNFSVRRESVCSFGFEANPAHKDRLEEVEKCYLQQGWQAEFQIRAVGNSDTETVSIWTDPNSTYEDWGAGLEKRSDLKKEHRVPMIDIAKFIKETVNYYGVDGSKVFMKMDIEGSEYFVLDAMIKSGILCKDVIGSAVIEYHPWFKNGIKQNKNLNSSWNRIDVNLIRNVSNCEPTMIVPLDDETYLHDGMDLPCQNRQMNSTELDEALVNFTKSENFIHSPNHSLQLCYIPKNACSKFKSLFYKLNTGQSLQARNYRELVAAHSKVGYRDVNNPFIPNYKLSVKRLLANTTWHSLVVLRDPLERLVSGFADKCIGQQWCEGKGTTDFKVFADRVVNKIENGHVVKINNHFRPQYTFCGMDKYFDYFDYVIYFDKATIAEKTFAMLKKEDIEQAYYNWGDNSNETLFDAMTPHSNKNDSEHSLIGRAAFYSNYYDKELAEKVMNAFKNDYELLKLEKPKWIEYLKN